MPFIKILLGPLDIHIYVKVVKTQWQKNGN